MSWCWEGGARTAEVDLRAVDAMVMRQSVKGWQFMAADLEGSVMELRLLWVRDDAGAVAKLQTAAQLWTDAYSQSWELSRVDLFAGGMSVVLRRAKTEVPPEGRESQG